jgi:hypothetical protein
LITYIDYANNVYTEVPGFPETVPAPQFALPESKAAIRLARSLAITALSPSSSEAEAED